MQTTLAVAGTGVETATGTAPATRKVVKDYTADGLRGAVAILVFFTHFLVAFFPGGFDVLLPGLQTSPATNGTIERILRLPFISIFWNGNFMVMFFVISGYVLSRPYYFGNQLDTLRDRNLRRYLRLGVPTAASVFIGYFLLKYGLLWNHAAAAISHSDWLNSYYAFKPTFLDALRDASYRVLLMRADQFNPPLWTMKIEFIGSLITFSFYALMPARGLWRKVIHYAIAVLSIGVLAKGDGIYYYAFLLGGLIWILPKPKGIYKWLLLAAALYLECFQYDARFRWMPDPGVWDQKFFYGVIGGFLMFWFLRSGAWDRVLASPPMRVLGRASYSMYLTHFFVLCTFSSWFFIHTQCRFSRPVWASADLLLSTVLVFAVGYAFEHLVDRPGTRFAKWFIGRPA
jgi:peptidoglycan/LPS O-acetylase OafA/YrhL